MQQSFHMIHVEVLGCSRLVFMSFQLCFVCCRMVLVGMVYGIQNVCGVQLHGLPADSHTWLQGGRSNHRIIFCQDGDLRKSLNKFHEILAQIIAYLAGLGHKCWFAFLWAWDLHMTTCTTHWHKIWHMAWYIMKDMCTKRFWRGCRKARNILLARNDFDPIQAISAEARRSVR